MVNEVISPSEERIKALKLAIDKILASKEEIRLLELGKLSGELPIRVTHNDTKINNVKKR